MKQFPHMLFLVGAPKSGTTSLAHYLSNHRQVFMTEPKEPNYFARSLSLPGGYLSRQDWHTSLASWEQLFEAASPDTLVAGEASTRYLRCKDALSYKLTLPLKYG
jgi:hypothetical protein